MVGLLSTTTNSSVLLLLLLLAGPVGEGDVQGVEDALELFAGHPVSTTFSLLLLWTHGGVTAIALLRLVVRVQERVQQDGPKAEQLVVEVRVRGRAQPVQEVGARLLQGLTNKYAKLLFKNLEIEKIWKL